MIHGAPQKLYRRCARSKHALAKLSRASDQLVSLQSDETPNRDTDFALSQIRVVFDELQNSADAVSGSADADLMSAFAADITKQIAIHLPLLGFIRRSSNVRNAFEFYGPIVLLARQLLGNETRFIHSSEWDYSPFTYPKLYKHLEDFVLIGLPASESSNALILPLCGHELGHHVWGKKNIHNDFTRRIVSAVIDQIIARRDEFERHFPVARGADKEKLLSDIVLFATWAPARDWALRQAEEVFCDFMGVRIFGESFLYAYEYLVAPELGSNRTPVYPSSFDRAKFLEEAARSRGVSVPADYAKQFRRETFRGTQRQRLLLSIADEVVGSTVADLANAAWTFCANVGVPELSSSDSAFKAIKLCLPPETARLSEVMNGAWRANLDESLWAEQPKRKKNKSRILNDVVLKALEVMEANELWERGPDAT